MKTTKKVIYTVLTVSAFSILAVGSVEEESSDKTSSNSKKHISEEEKIMRSDSLNDQEKDSLIAVYRANNTITAGSLYNEYLKNEVNADDQFKNKTLYVRGKVLNVKKDMFDDIYVSLETNDVMGTIQCYLDDSDVASKLNRGDSVLVKGYCTGLSVVSIVLKNTEVLSVE